MRTYRLAGFAALVLALALGASLPAAAQKQGGALVAAVYAGANSIDPHFTGSYPARTLIAGVYETLVTVDEDGSPIPMLAEKYTISPDGLTYTFALRHGVKFHNGKEMTSADVKASLERFAKLSPEKIIMAGVVSIAAPDPYNVVLTMKEPNPTFIDRFASPTTPASIIPAEEAAKDLNKAAPIGTGPYEIADWVPDDHLTLKRFDGYVPDTAFPGATGLGGNKHAYLDTVTFRIIPEPSARVAALEAGQVQFIDDVPPATAKRLQADGKFPVLDIKTFQMPALIMNFAAAPTNSLKIRQALQAALDVEGMMPIIADNGPFNIGTSLLYPGNAMYSDAGKELYNQNNADKAKALLKDAGYKGAPIVFDVGTLGFMTREGLAITAQLQAVGINVKQQTMDIPTLLSAFNSDAGWNMATNGFGSQPFLGAYSWQRLMQGASNLSRVKSDPQMDALWQQFNQAPDAAGRKAAFEKIQAYTFQQVYFIKLGDIGIDYALSPNVVGFKPWNGAARFWNVSLK